MIDKQKIGSFIAERRRALGLTQQNLADRLNVTDKAVSKWERGLCYPDITIVFPLAQVLDVTERELLSGMSTSEETETLPLPSDFVTLSYLGTTTQERRTRAVQVLMVLFNVSLILGVFISMVVDLAINRRITWSLIVLASSVLAWAVVYPMYRVSRHKLFFSCLSLTVCIAPFLATIEYAIPLKGWLICPALPITTLSLALLWIPVLLHTFTKINKWYIFALLCLLSEPFSMYINRLSGSDPDFLQDFVGLLASILSASVLFCAGWFLHRRRAT